MIGTLGKYSKIIDNPILFEEDIIGYSNSDNDENYFESRENYLPNQSYDRQFSLNQEKNDFIKRLASCIQNQHFEYGKISMADQLVTEALDKDVSKTKSFLNEFFVSNFNKPFLLIGILQIVSSQPTDIINPEGYVMATAAISNKNIEVRECAIRCFENWVSTYSLNILENIKTTPAWLQDYVDVVKENIKEELCLIS